MATKYKHEADELAATKKWRDIHKIWAEYKDKPRKEAAANFRLKIGHDCLAAHLKKTDMYESNEFTVCQMPNSSMDEEHLLLCPKLDTNEQVLKNTIKLLGRERDFAITSPPSAIGITTSISLLAVYNTGQHCTV